MTATEILRRMLDERGVGWRGGLPTETIVTDPIDVLYVQRTDGMIHVYIRSYLTPEQAIAATLGAGTCHITPKFTCSECGHQYPTRNYESYETCDGRTAFAPLGHYVLNCKKPNYCPNCGRKVVTS